MAGTEPASTIRSNGAWAGQPVRSVAGLQHDIVAAQLAQQRLDRLRSADRAAAAGTRVAVKPRQDGRGIAGDVADDQQHILRPRLGGLQQLAQGQRLDQEAARPSARSSSP